MKLLGTLGAATLGLLLLSGTLAGQSPPAQEQGAGHPALPEGHPPIPKELICPVTGAVGKPGSTPEIIRPPAEGLVRI